jgi:Zn-finger nucleic acid-binding protein
MREVLMRYPCPVCLGVVMDTHRIGKEKALEVDHCRRCGGVWFDAGEVQRLRAYPAAALWARVPRQEAEPVTPCHNCHAPLSRDVEKCPGCSTRNLLDCPVCDRLMQRQEVSGIHVDVCRKCKGAWFDHSELDAIWKLAAPAAAGGAVAGAAYTAGDAAVDVLFWAPDLAFHAVAGTAHAVSHLPDAIGAVPDVAAGLAGAAVDAAGAAGGVGSAIFEAIAAIFEAILGGIDF